jgi:4-diphosphocytidyl-2-C-methyl-D-erythritol kinase
MILNSYAKLNLYLEVLNRRQDNYHNLKTIFERIDLSDKIILKSRPDKKIKISSNLAVLPKDSSNLAYRSAKLLQDSFRINKGVDIKIIKRIPVGSGLGGGSSNAATVLLGLSKLWRLKLKPKELANFAGKIGSDVAFFIYGHPFALGLLRGEKIKPLKMLKRVRLWHILAVPKIRVLTSDIYRKWDECPESGLTRPKYGVKMLNLGLKRKDLSLIGKTLFNSLEAVTSGLYPRILDLKEKLSLRGVKSILMSGSGPAVFGIVSSRKEAVALSKRLKKEDRSWQIFVTRTI